MNKDNMWEIDLVAIGGRRENEEGFGAGGLLIILHEKIVAIGGPNERTRENDSTYDGSGSSILRKAPRR